MLTSDVSITHQWGQQLLILPSTGLASNWTLYVLSRCWASCRAVPDLIMNTHTIPPYSCICIHRACSLLPLPSPPLHLIHMNKQTCRDATELNAVDSVYSPTYWLQDLTDHLSASDTGPLHFITFMGSPLKLKVCFSSCSPLGVWALLKRIPGVLANQLYLPANLMLLTHVGPLLILPQLRKNYLEICSTHNVPSTQNQGKKKKGGGGDRGRGGRTKIWVKVARANLGLLQKLLVLQEQHPETTKNKWYLDLHNNINRVPFSINNDTGIVSFSSYQVSQG